MKYASFLLLLLLVPQDEGISRDEWRARRDAVVEKCGDGAVILEAGTISGGKSSDHNAHKFDFRYLTGVQINDAILVILPEGKKTLLFADGDVEKLKKQTGIEHVMKRSKFDGFARDVLAVVKTFHLKRRSSLQKTLKEANEDAEFTSSLGGHLQNMRIAKSKAEVKAMQVAADATCEAHKAAMRNVKPGMNEAELQKLIEDTFRKHGATGICFPSIVGSGINGTVLHYHGNNKDMEDGTLVVMDIGAEYHGYGADITRTLPINGKFSKEQRKAYQCVLDAQRAAEKILKPGVTWQELHAAAAGVFKDREMTDWSYAHSRTRNPSVRHGLGHYLGLHVHDVGSYRQKLVEGMVITIEPGYYNKDSRFGIRIEDTYLLTKDGWIRTSKNAPREIDEVEKMMAGDE